MTAEVLGLLQAWLAEERYAGSRLVFVTRGAIGGPGGPGTGSAAGGGVDVAGRAVWGLVRAAQARAPGPVRLG